MGPKRGRIGWPFVDEVIDRVEEVSSGLHHVGYDGFGYAMVFNLEEAVISASLTDLFDHVSVIGAVEIFEVNERDGVANNILEIGTLGDGSDVV
ncbi:hypothetical protein HanPSC8_Chr03g0124641 [Helianthus annuus]|nr:hypothetical protein HanPSC8_Chr03g0124641 [Helianthus annuus]